MLLNNVPLCAEALPHFLTHLLSGTQGVSALGVMSDITPCLILWCGLCYVPSPHIHMGPSAPPWMSKTS